MAASPVPPRVHVMVVCDDIEPAEEEGVYNLIGVRTYIRANGFPYTHSQLGVYLQVTGHQGTASCRFAVVDADTDVELISSPEQAVSFSGPLEIVTSGWLFDNCTFPDAGLYYVQVYFDGKLRNERMLFLVRDGVLGDGQE